MKNPEDYILESAALTAQKRKELLDNTMFSTPVSGMRSLLGLICGYWKSDQKKTAGLMAGMLVALTIADIVISAKTGFVMKDLTDNFVSKTDFDIQTVKNIAYLLGISALVNPWIASKRHLTGNMLNISWRGWLTGRFIDAIKRNNTYHHLKNIPGPVKNPDQCIAEAPRDFSGNVTGLGMGAFSSLLKIGTFTGILASICETTPVNVLGNILPVPGPAFWAIYATAATFAVVQTKLFQKFGNPLHALNENQYLREANFRSRQIVVFKESGQIAAYGEKGLDRHRLKETFEKLQENSCNLAKANFDYSFSTGSFLQSSHLIYFLAGGAISKLSRDMTWGTAGQLTQAFTELQNGMAWWGNVVPDVSRMKAAGKLLTDLANQVELAQNPRVFYAQGGRRADIVVTREKRDSILLKDIVLDHPASGEPLLKVPELEIHQGEHLLINGKSGCGKTSLMNAAAGLFYYGSGDVFLPDDKSILMAAPYILPDATLKENIAFPQETKKFTDDQYIEALKHAELEELIPYLNAKERHNNAWDALSNGERQRLLYARVFTQRPDIVFLDETTSGMDEGLQNRISARMVANLPDMTVVSIAHRDLGKYHSRKLNIGDDGKITLNMLKFPASIPKSCAL